MKVLHHFAALLVTGTKLLARAPRQAHLHCHSRQRKLNTTLNGYIQSNSPSRALVLLQRLQRKGSSPIDSFTLLLMLKACAKTSSAIEGKQIHALIVNLGFEPIIFIQTALISMYSATGSLEDAHHVFNEIFTRNVVCWSALISAYVDNGRPNKALELFREMQMENVEPDGVTITIALSACADLGALDMGEWIHGYIGRKEGFKADLYLKNALINMYAKCGDIKTARRLFDKANQRDVMTWTSMIVGHAVHGQAAEALKLFAEMKDKANAIENNKNNDYHRYNDGMVDFVIPNEVTFIGVLMACSHGGLVEEGLQHLESMSKDYHLKPRICHYGCMVDLFCRAGLVKEAYTFTRNMPMRPNAVVWRTLLSACSLRGNVELGAHIKRRLLELEPDFAGDCVTISNMYATAGLWLEKSIARKQIKRRRDPGCSSIEVESRVHEFVAADRKHPLKREIYSVLEGLVRNLRASGYAPNSSNLADDEIAEE
ncbi:putative pentatricopeptide repeat-containing protein At1g74400 [Magnolia sinica]|uniref:putative pentatricopeptide repeat-containing protein At1g74400 n=1 Tax=Magnolia sinica TaxID=86752 RepID=UPI002658E44D|nr:putative pentatricopeptide repeat-containing protein At1g74400 [Magnolia sinica]